MCGDHIKKATTVQAKVRRAQAFLTNKFQAITLVQFRKIVVQKCSSYELTAKGNPDRVNWTVSLRQNYSAKIKRKWQETKNSGGK